MWPMAVDDISRPGILYLDSTYRRCPRGVLLEMIFRHALEHEVTLRIPKSMRYRQSTHGAVDGRVVEPDIASLGSGDQRGMDGSGVCR